jgi:hypothetical protein
MPRRRLPSNQPLEIYGSAWNRITEALDKIPQLEQRIRELELAVRMAKARQERIEHVVILDGEDEFGVHSWDEATYDDSAGEWIERDEGLTSTEDADDFDRPVLESIGPKLMRIGTGDEGEVLRYYLSTGVHLATITDVTGTTNATYDAEAIGNAAVAVADATPINRLFSTAEIEFNAASTGDLCLLIQDVASEATLLVILTETVDVDECT